MLAVPRASEAAVRVRHRYLKVVARPDPMIQAVDTDRVVLLNPKVWGDKMFSKPKRLLRIKDMIPVQSTDLWGLRPVRPSGIFKARTALDKRVCSMLKLNKNSTSKAYLLGLRRVQPHDLPAATR